MLLSLRHYAIQLKNELLVSKPTPFHVFGFMP